MVSVWVDGTSRHTISPNYIYIETAAYMQLFQTKNGSPGDFPLSVYHLLIVKTEVCHLSACLQRKKQKLSICKRTKWTERMNHTCPSMCIVDSKVLRRTTDNFSMSSLLVIVLVLIVLAIYAIYIQYTTWPFTVRVFSYSFTVYHF